MKKYIIAIIAIILIIAGVFLIQEIEQKETILVVNEEGDIVGEAYSSLFHKSWENEDSEEESYETDIINE